MQFRDNVCKSLKGQALLLPKPGQSWTCILRFWLTALPDTETHTQTLTYTPPPNIHTPHIRTHTIHIPYSHPYTSHTHTHIPFSPHTHTPSTYMPHIYTHSIHIHTTHSLTLTHSPVLSSGVSPQGGPPTHISLSWVLCPLLSFS